MPHRSHHHGEAVEGVRDTFDLVIKGGQVIDGTGTARCQATVAVVAGRIAAVGQEASQDLLDQAVQVIELGVLSLEEAVRRMTGLPADFLRLKDRGLIRPGYAADIVVFDPESVRSNGTYVDPSQHPDGISTVIVNGVVTFANAKHTGALAGKVLRK